MHDQQEQLRLQEELRRAAMEALEARYYPYSKPIQDEAVSVLRWLRDLTKNDLQATPEEIREALLGLMARTREVRDRLKNETPEQRLAAENENLKQRLAEIHSIATRPVRPRRTTKEHTETLFANHHQPATEGSVGGLPKDLSGALRGKRRELGHLQKIAATICNVRLDTYRGWERGQRRPSLANQKAVKAYLVIEEKPAAPDPKADQCS
jgi:hypothetical protein